MKRTLLLAATVIAVAGCATVSQMTATGGSRADGIVRLSYEVGMFDKVQIDEMSSLNTARRRCGTWGYNDAEAFGGVTRQCQSYGSMGCMRWFVTKEYQCTSNASASVAGSTTAIQPLAETGPLIAAASNDAPGTINLGDGVKLIPAKTISGYCIKAPSGYQGSGSVNRPAVTSARPRCN
jgi:hypothetical protein